MDRHWAVTTSSGRRVSLLCDEHIYAPSPPPSPLQFGRPHPVRTDSVASNGSASSLTSLSTISSQGIHSPPTPPNIAMPPMKALTPLPENLYFQPLYERLSPDLGPSPILMASMPSTERGLSPTSALPPSPQSPASTVSSATQKKSSRRYACHCGKSFTTSGHLARHTRIHTGEKNYICPEDSCKARFSRQDNCMQHFRTHQSGSTNKRASRRRRQPTESKSQRGCKDPSIADQEPVPLPQPIQQQEHEIRYQPQSPFYPPIHTSQFNGAYAQSFGSEAGLAALANVACADYS